MSKEIKNAGTAAQPPQVHELKTDPDMFDAVMAGAKTVEVRYDDRHYLVGDYLNLRRTVYSADAMRSGAPLMYTGEAVLVQVTHKLKDLGLLPNWCALTIKKIFSGVDCCVETPPPAEEEVQIANKPLADTRTDTCSGQAQVSNVSVKIEDETELMLFIGGTHNGERRLVSRLEMQVWLPNLTECRNALTCAVNWPRNAPIGNECYRREATIQSGVQEVMVSNSIAQDQILNALIRGYTGPEPAKEAV